jgi:NADH-quinone oxidoreductase subunit A
VLTVLAAAPSPAWPYWPILLLLLLAISFAVGVLVLTHVLGPRRSGAIKEGTYESGMTPIATAHQRFNVRYYLLAMTFLVFDVEIIFLYPWATTFRQIEPGGELGGLFLGRILFFLFASAVAYVYAWRKGVFRFD